eukprot:GHVS01050437.1.p1 GENE.GHVS01050437.1~~GHVS01050437.1.p1  ORF type:complete len:368 (+),score=74.37 GHVS01050437.1:67-1104(+)
MNTGGVGSARSSLLRIHRELREITNEPSPFWCAYPLNIEEPFEWHFTLRGPAESDFSGGLYHGRIVLPQSYPFAPPSVMLLTPNGRFEVGKKVCLSATNYHPEMWQPAWGLRTMLDALHAFFPTKSEGALHSLEWPGEIRRKLASESVHFTCSVCKTSNHTLVEEKCAKPTTKRPVLPPDIKAVPLPISSQSTSSLPPPSVSDQTTSSLPSDSAINCSSYSSTAATPSASSSSSSSADVPPSTSVPHSSSSSSTASSLSSSSSDKPSSSSNAPAPTADARRARVADRSATAGGDRNFFRQVLCFPENRVDAVICAADIGMLLLVGGIFVLLMDIFLEPPRLFSLP